MAATELFESICRHPGAPRDPNADALIAIARSLHARGLTPSYGPGDHGNLSCRTPQGCLISARATRKDALGPDVLVSLVGSERTATGIRIIYDGERLPSTDALMHWQI